MSSWNSGATDALPEWTPKPYLRLPQELLVLVLQEPALKMKPERPFITRGSPNAYYQENCDGNAVFLALRRVNRNMKSTVEKLYPTAIAFMRDRIIEGLVLRPSKAHAAELSCLPWVSAVSSYENPTRSSALLERAPRELDMEGINTFLSASEGLKRLRWNFHANSSIDLAKLDLACGRRLEIMSLYLAGPAQLADLNVGGMEHLHGLRLRGRFGVAGEVTVPALAGGPIELPPHLTKLALCQLQLPVTTIKAMQDLHGLCDLDLSSSPLSEAHFQELALSRFPKLVKVGLYKTEASDASVRALDLKNSSVRELVLSSNDIKDPRCLDLEENNTLEQLSLGFNPLTSLDFGLGNNTTLRALKLSYCRDALSNPSRTTSFATQLGQNRTLCRLDLTACSLTDASLNSLHLERNTGIRTLLLGHDSLTDDGLRRSGIAAHPTLRTLQLDWSSWNQGSRPSTSILRELTTSTLKVLYRLDFKSLST